MMQAHGSNAISTDEQVIAGGNGWVMLGVLPSESGAQPVIQMAQATQ
jgi:hypothetical protein